MPIWTDKYLKTMLREKRKHPHMPWEKVSQLLGHRHSARACNRKYLPFAPKMKNPLNLAERRKVCKMRNKKPPMEFRKIATQIPGISSADCRFYYEKCATAKEVERGIQEARAEQERIDFLKGRGIVIPKPKLTLLPQTWTPTEVDQLKKMRQEQQMPWAVVAKELKRSIPSCTSKLRRLNKKEQKNPVTMNTSTKRRRDVEDDDYDTIAEVKIEPVSVKKRKIAKPSPIRRK
ncbi:hypothetical protein BDA99DRAFT_537438 [Phascolomyces articulosus]|uniref:Myb-like domain-containing protein n=1 Tax=Phascolomyces articulosus TaxID=60185 RepID=A0AAD5KA53_9FUNG|nr:hypothetical protein BDA99DRAFT_537438 [Phascolomyces articulosus]